VTPPTGKIFSVDFFGFDIPERVLLAGLVSLSTIQDISFRHHDQALLVADTNTDLLVVDAADPKANARALEITSQHAIPTIRVDADTQPRGTLGMHRPLQPAALIAAMRESVIRHASLTSSL
jgi:hypothetical protein